MNDSVETIERNGYTVKIEYDMDPESPLEYDNLGTVVDLSRKYSIGDRKATDTELDALHRGGVKLLERYLSMTEGATAVLPIYLFDHSGISIRTDPSGFRAADSHGWDWGIAGFIYDARSDRENVGTPVELAREVLVGEVETLNLYISGQVYGYVIEDAEGEEVDSCWGFLGLESAIEEANAVVDGLPYQLSLPESDPYATDEDEEIASELGITVTQLRTDRRGQDLTDKLLADAA